VTLQVLDKFVIRGDKLAAFSLGQSNIEAVIDTDS
jgi:hypothetical protein